MTATSTRSSTTKKSTKNARVPRLRFPEFEGSEEWERTTIEKSCDLLNNHRAPIRASNRISGPIPYYGASGIVDYIDDYIFDDELLLVGEDGAKWGAFENTAFIVRGKCWVNNHAHVLKPHLLNILFLEAYLIKIDLFPYVTGAAPPKLTLTQLKSITIPLPSLPEQQKIADCLSSLDDLITAESAKLEALKEHKKGLMQELFPREGETTPRLRFPEFEGSGEWTSRSMHKVYSFLGNNSLSRQKLNYESGTILNIHYGDIHTKFRSHFDVGRELVPYVNDNENHSAIRSDNYCRNGDLVFADASEDLADIGKVIEIIDAGKNPLVAGLHTILARPLPKHFVLGFGAFLFSSPSIRHQIQRESQGTKVLGLSAKRLATICLKFPPTLPEQQKIASVLSSLDDRITAQAERIDTLKAHKKGLMQQLFPVMEG